MRKHKKENLEPMSGPGWAAYEEVPEDFDYEAWNMNEVHRLHRYSLSRVFWNLVRYPFTFLKSIFFRPKIDDDFEEYEESPEEIRFHKLMFEIWDAHKIEFEKFAIQLIESGKAEIELSNHRIIYQKEKMYGNWGVSEFTEKLDGSDRFNRGWFMTNGNRDETPKNIGLHLAGTAASLEFNE